MPRQRPSGKPAAPQRLDFGAGIARRRSRVTGQNRGTILLPHCTGLAAATAAFGKIAAGLTAYGFKATPLQLLSPEEAAHGYHLFDIDLLAQRIVDAVASLEGAPVGLFGHNLEAAAILVAAAQPDCAAHALVLCNARPDLAPDAPPAIRVPTLCLVEDEELALDLNRKALARLGDIGELAILPAGQAISSPATAAQVTDLAAAWFAQYLPVVASNGA